MHVFKLEATYADLFIYGLNLNNRKITYEVRDKDDGKLMEPRTTSKIQFTEDRILFDERHIKLNMVPYIYAVLNDKINEQVEPDNQSAETNS